MKEDIRLTRLASCSGCGAKVGAGVLEQLLKNLPTLHDERLIVGFDKSDDASVYVINETTALVQTLDFFPPIVDDPRMFGQIAACNALSDVYAMGGEPKLVMNIMTVTKDMDKATVQQILMGGYEKVFEAGAIVTGGHTIHDKEPKYGLSVTGFVHPDKVITNSGALPGDVLILTKPLGIGIINTAAKAGLVSDALMEAATIQMSTLNKAARDCMLKYRTHACTDVTGFSLLGHGLEMAAGSDVTLHIKKNCIPYHKAAIGFAEMGFVPEGAYRNRDYAEAHTLFDCECSRSLKDVLFDPQTSGGLLISVHPEDAEQLVSDINNALCANEASDSAITKNPCHAVIIGNVSPYDRSRIIIED